MKKLILILALILTMASSIVAGTLAMYNVSIDNVADGSLVAKEFIFTEAGADNFQKSLKIAPTESDQWIFGVKNYHDNVVSETDMYYKLTFHVQATSGKQAIAPLVVTVKDGTGTVLNSVTGEGTFDVLGSFPVAPSGQEAYYTVDISWPDGGDADINYAGNHYGTSINVDAVASQVPFDGSGNDGGGGTENPPHKGQVSVLYETTAPWGDNNKYKFNITIYNNSKTPINNWNMAFSLRTDRLNKADDFWNAILLSSSPAGSYQFINHGYNNPETDSIQPGKSVSFGGFAYGSGNDPLQNIQVKGDNIDTPITDVDLTTSFGTLH